MISLFKVIINILMVLNAFNIIILIPVIFIFIGIGDGRVLGLIISMLIIAVLLYLKDHVLLDENKRPKELGELVRAYKKGEIDKIYFFKSVIDTIGFLNLLVCMATILFVFSERYLWFVIPAVTGAIILYVKRVIKNSYDI